MGNLGATELIIIAVVIILLFGAKKLPDMARSLGKSAKILKAETRGLREDDDAPQQHNTTATQQQPVQSAPQQLPPAQPQVVQQPVVAPPLEHKINENN